MKQLPKISLSGEQFADLLGVTSGRISQMVASGALTESPNGYDLDSIRQAFVYYRNLTDMAAIKREKAELETQLIRIAVQKANEEVFLVSDVQRAWADIVLRTRDSFRRLGAKVSPMLPYCKNEISMQEKIDKEVDEILTELSRPRDYQQEQR